MHCTRIDIYEYRFVVNCKLKPNVSGLIFALKMSSEIKANMSISQETASSGITWSKLELRSKFKIFSDFLYSTMESYQSQIRINVCIYIIAIFLEELSTGMHCIASHTSIRMTWALLGKQ